MAYLVYGDESGQTHSGRGATRYYVFSLLLVPEETWRDACDRLKAFRNRVRTAYGIRLREELHSVDLVAGRGDLGPQPVGKWERSRVLSQHLQTIERLSELKCTVINACVDKTQARWLWGVERALTRLQVTLEKTLGARAVLILDQGKDHIIRGLARRLAVYNPVPGRFGGKVDVPLTRVLGDPLFADSRYDYFLQAADAVAFALLKREEPPTPNIAKYGIDRMFDTLDAVLCRVAHPEDPRGVIRVP